jgi:acetolactate synthase-1/2/3 large subunit
MRAVDALMECLKAEGVDVVFGLPGGANLPTYDAFYDAGIRHILVRHEAGGGHAAEGYAKATGKVGVALATSGPGATNVVTPICDAMMDSVPVVFITGQVRTELLGTDGFQEADTIGITMPVVKHSFLIQHPLEIPRSIHEAFHLARTGRPGPVVVDIPQDLSRADIPYEPVTDVHLPGYNPTTEGNQKQIRLAAKALANARRPVLYVGGGVVNANAGPELVELATADRFPVTCTVMGLGAFPAPHEQWLGMLGMHGTRAANYAMDEADLIVAIGARFDDRVTGSIAKFAPAAKAAAKERRGGIVHFDILPKNINKVVQATEAVEGDVSANLKLLLPHVQAKTTADRQPWFDQINAWKKKWPLSDYERAERSGLIKPQTLIEELSNLTAQRKHDTYIATGVGQHQMWVAQHFRWRHPRSMITSGGLGTMGYGLPAAIGAKVAKPDSLVIDIDGDASFAMTLTELATAAQFNIGVKVIVLNNEEQGMVTQWQNLFYEDRYSHTHQRNPDFMKLADAMGIQHRRLVKPDDTVEALRWLIDSEGPALLEVVTDKKVPVLPMVPAGSGLHEFITWDSGMYCLSHCVFGK